MIVNIVVDDCQHFATVRKVTCIFPGSSRRSQSNSVICFLFGRVELFWKFPIDSIVPNYLKCAFGDPQAKSVFSCLTM